MNERFVFIVMALVLFSGCEYMIGPGPTKHVINSGVFWSLGVPYDVKDLLVTNQIEGDVVNVQSVRMRLVMSRKFRTFGIGDGSRDITAWQKFDLVKEEHQLIRRFTFKEKVNAALVLADNKNDFILTFEGNSFIREFRVSNDGLHIDKIKNISKHTKPVLQEPKPIRQKSPDSPWACPRC